MDRLSESIGYQQSGNLCFGDNFGRRTRNNEGVTDTVVVVEGFRRKGSGNQIFRSLEERKVNTGKTRCYDEHQTGRKF